MKTNLLLASLLAGVISTVTAAERTYVGGRFMLQLDGGAPGALHSVEGGAVKGDVVTFSSGTELVQKKHIGNVKYEEFTMKLGANLGKDVYDWISGTVDGAGVRKNGSIIAADFDYKARQAANFSDALISEITIPACDGASKEPAYLTVKFAPELIKWISGKDLKTSLPGAKKQKMWVASNFRLEIDGLDGRRVSKVDAFTIKQKFVEYTDGTSREPVKVPGKIEYPNLVVTIPAAFAEKWIDWAEDFLVDGNNSDSEEKDGTLTFLTPDLSEELIRVSLKHLGVARLHRSLSDGNGASTVTLELYVEGMEIDFMAQFEK